MEMELQELSSPSGVWYIQENQNNKLCKEAKRERERERERETTQVIMNLFLHLRAAPQPNHLLLMRCRYICSSKRQVGRRRGVQEEEEEEEEEAEDEHEKGREKERRNAKSLKSLMA